MEIMKQMSEELTHHSIKQVPARRVRATIAANASVQPLKCKATTHKKKSYNQKSGNYSPCGKKTLSKPYSLRERRLTRKCCCRCEPTSTLSSADDKVQRGPTLHRMLNSASSFLNSKVYVEVSAKFNVIQLINEELTRLGLAGSCKITETDENIVQKSVGVITTLSDEQVKMDRSIQVTLPNESVNQQSSDSTDWSFVINEENGSKRNSLESVLDDASSDEKLSLNFEESNFSDILDEFLNDKDDEAFERIVNKTCRPPPSQPFQCRLCENCFVSSHLLDIHTLRCHMNDFLRSVKLKRLHEQHENHNSTNNSVGNSLSSSIFSDTVSMILPNLSGKTGGEIENYQLKNDAQPTDGNVRAVVLTGNCQKLIGVEETSLNETNTSAIYSL